MNINFLVIFFLYFVVSFSVIGYGYLFCKFILKEKENFNHGYFGLFGFFILITYSYLSHFFFAHSLVHNSLIIVFGFLIFVVFLRKNLKDIFFTSGILLVFFISLMILKTHDDFPYYHFGYSYYLTDSPLMIGIGKFNHGFRTPSSIFYLNSLFYLPIIKFYFFHLPSVLIIGFVNIIFIKYLIKNIKIIDINFISYFILFSILFINIFFYRMAEHGTDRSAQVIIFLLLSEILILINMKSFQENQLTKILLLIGIIISLKAFYILYVAMFIPVYLSMKNNFNFKKIFTMILKNLLTYFFCFLLLMILITNLFNTGCLIYPVNFSCFNSLDWSIPSSQVINMNNWYEQWSKGGAAPNFRVDNPEIYILGFNWVSNWIDIYFFNKVSDFLLGVVFIVLVVLTISYSKNKKKIKINKNINFLYLVILLLLFEWFYNHPALRYGGYVLICSAIFIPSSLIIESFNLNYKRTVKNFTFLIILSFFIFFIRNVSRVNNEIKQYAFQPFKDFSFRISENHYRLNIKMKNLIKNYEKCNTNSEICDQNLKSKVSKKMNKYIFIRN